MDAQFTITFDTEALLLFAKDLTDLSKCDNGDELDTAFTTEDGNLHVTFILQNGGPPVGEVIH